MIIKRVRKYGPIACLIALIIGFVPGLLGLQNDHPVEELAEDVLTSSLCANCDFELDLSPGKSGFFSEDDKPPIFSTSQRAVESPDASVSRETFQEMPALPKEKSKIVSPGETLPEPEKVLDESKGS